MLRAPIPALAGAVLLMAAAAACHARPQALVVGCENQISDSQWADTRINFGITSLIAEQLADSGVFALDEEKPEVRDRLAAARALLWDKGGRKARKEIENLMQSPPVYVIGRLVSFGAPVTTVGFAGVGGAHSQVVVATEIDLVLPEGKTITGSGSGSATRSAASVLFSFREEGPFFDQTTVGVALKASVGQAVADALRRYRRHVEE